MRALNNWVIEIQMRADLPTCLTPVHVQLERHAATCIGLLESTDHPKAKRILRLLVVDLLVEAEQLRNARTRISRRDG